MYLAILISPMFIICYSAAASLPSLLSATALTAHANPRTGDCKQLSNIDNIPSRFGKLESSLITLTSTTLPSTITAFQYKFIVAFANLASTRAGATASLPNAIALGPVKLLASR